MINELFAEHNYYGRIHKKCLHDNKKVIIKHNITFLLMTDKYKDGHNDG